MSATYVTELIRKVIIDIKKASYQIEKERL